MVRIGLAMMEAVYLAKMRMCAPRHRLALLEAVLEHFHDDAAVRRAVLDFSKRCLDDQVEAGRALAAFMADFIGVEPPVAEEFEWQKRADLT